MLIEDNIAIYEYYNLNNEFAPINKVQIIERSHCWQTITYW